MVRVKKVPVLALAVVVLIAAGCVELPPHALGLIVFCDHVEMDLAVGSLEPAAQRYVFVMIEKTKIEDDEVPVLASADDPLPEFDEMAEMAKAAGAALAISGNLDQNQHLQFNETLDGEFPVGTQFLYFLAVDPVGEDDSRFMAVGFTPCIEPDDEDDTPHETWFEPGDDRINVQAYASVAVYCDADLSRVGVYGIDTSGQGVGVLFVAYPDLPDVPADGNALITESGGVQFYRLTSGEYQVITAPDAEGKQYVVIFDGCPNTYLNAYILQNGVLTQTEAS